MLRITLSSFFILFFSCVVFSQWNPNTSINTPVCVMNGRQNDARMQEDGSGGVFITWKDARVSNINPDIYIQHIDSAGIALWNANGLGICTDSSDQSTPSIISDGAGGVIVSWTDRRSGLERDVFAQRISANGTILWQTDGMPVATKPQREHNEKIISDDAGGAIIVWEQFDTINFLWDVWAQRINSSGNPVWAPGGIPICNLVANRLNPKIQKDKKGGAIICWQDYRNGFDYDIYAQRINANGTLMWGSTGTSIVATNGSQINPKIDPDSLSGGAYIAWTDKRNGLDYDIYAQRVDSSGNIMWPTNGVAACSAIGNQSAVDILSNEFTYGLILTWKDDRSANTDIYAQKINWQGLNQWTPNGIPICVGPKPQLNPNICADATSGAIITWQDSTVNDYDIKAQHVDGFGIVQWAVNGVVVSDCIEIQGHPKNCRDGKGGSIFAWQDKRSGFYDIYCHHLYADGTNVGIKENKKNYSIKIFPNPFENNFSVSFALEKEQEVSLTVYNVLGEEVVHTNTTQKAGAQTLQANTSAFPAGIYFLKLAGQDFSETLKLIKQ